MIPKGPFKSKALCTILQTVGFFTAIGELLNCRTTPYQLSAIAFQYNQNNVSIGSQKIGHDEVTATHLTGRFRNCLSDQIYGKSGIWGAVTRPRSGRRGNRSSIPRKSNGFSFLRNFWTGFGSTLTYMWHELVIQSPDVRQREAVHTHSPSEVFKNKWSYTSTYPRVFFLVQAEL